MHVNNSDANVYGNENMNLSREESSRFSDKNEMMIIMDDEIRSPVDDDQPNYSEHIEEPIGSNVSYLSYCIFYNYAY